MAASFETKIRRMPEPPYSTIAKRRLSRARDHMDGALDPSEPVPTSPEESTEATELEPEDTGCSKTFLARVGKCHVARHQRTDGDDLPDRSENEGRVHLEIPREEVFILADLLRRNFKYEPSRTT